MLKCMEYIQRYDQKHTKHTLKDLVGFENKGYLIFRKRCMDFYRSPGNP